MAEWIASDACVMRSVLAGSDRFGHGVSRAYYLGRALSGGGGTGLPDRSAGYSWQALVDYLVGERTVKVMHACLEDLELLHHHLGIIRAMCLIHSSLMLLMRISVSVMPLWWSGCSACLPKHETRSNWLQRPLSDDQIRYAEEDVIYLIRFMNICEKIAGRC